MTRREMLAHISRAIGLTVAGIVGVPALVYGVTPAVRGRPESLWRPVGAPADFPVGRVTEAAVPLPHFDWGAEPAKKGVYVWRQAEDQWVVFSRACTDLGCPVRFDPGAEVFFCPCHGGIFAKDGERMAGPPKRPLYRYALRVRDGQVEIDLSSVPPMA